MRMTGFCVGAVSCSVMWVGVPKVAVELTVGRF
ncbi:hypothetical protein AG1IA_04918 [Rhizoctonia solani AG-1 IA]|uniref:Uncharacterized protein n=1 Tax=Thanatephorus cucumeris (strain AG1-IA) TaxID=983506 RepID=L8WSD7_THACA|nr:hypothetical protein AG1IA_04918 [Rhizoctonia solani AG-1 IA]